MADEAEEITIEIIDDTTATVVDAPVSAPLVETVAVQPAPTDNPEEGVEALKRQIATRDAQLREFEERSRRDATARVEAERRATQMGDEARRSAIIAADSQFDSIANALNASNREMEGLQQLKAVALEKGEFTDVAKIDAQMSKVGARVVQFETAKAQLEDERKRAPVVEQTVAQPTVSDDQRREQFLANLPPQSAAWIRGLPNNRYFTDPAFASKVNAAAQYAEQVKGINHNSGDYFRFIEQEVGLATAPVVTAAVSAAAAPVHERQSAPTRAAAPVAAAPSRSVPDAVGQPKKASSVTLSAAEREMAKTLFPKRLSTDPDPEVAYARNKLALLNDPRSSYGRAQ
jgi:hypothetical protein